MRITVCVGVNETVGANASDEQFAVALDVVTDLQQSRRQSHVEQYVAVSVAVEQRPVYMTIRQGRPSPPTAMTQPFPSSPLLSPPLLTGVRENFWN